LDQGTFVRVFLATSFGDVDALFAPSIIAEPRLPGVPAWSASSIALIHVNDIVMWRLNVEPHWLREMVRSDLEIMPGGMSRTASEG
jgi:hypothetical protein